VSEEKGLFDRLRERGDEVLTQVSGELMSNPSFMKAMEGALRGKQKLDEAAAKALKGMNIPTRTEFKRAVSRVEALESEVAGLKARLKKAQANSPQASKAQAQKAQAQKAQAQKATPAKPAARRPPKSKA
jgi:hypothetical protein